MNIKRAKQEIKDAIEAYFLKDEFGEYVIPSLRQRPILLLGAPGIGKTQIMAQIAAELKIGLVAYTITHHTRQSAIGLPFIVEKEYGEKTMSVTEYTMSEIVASVYEKMEALGCREGILFIDEINCVSETLAPAMLQFLQYKSFGNHQIPEGWIIVAAGNPPEYNRSVREFDVVTYDRVKKIEVEPDFGAWKEYAYQAGVHEAVLSYLNLRPQNFYRMETTVDGKSFATPRGWEDLSGILKVYEKLNKKADAELVIQYIQHEQIAMDFANYLELYKKYRADYQIERIFAGEIDPILVKKAAHASFDEHLSVISMLLSKLQNVFTEVWIKEQILGNVMRILREWQMAGEADGILSLQTLLDNYDANVKKEKENGILTKMQETIARRSKQLLNDYIRQLRSEKAADTATGFQIVRKLFAAENEQLFSLQDQAGEMLERAFDFMEAVFSDTQEMSVFMTELNSQTYALSFLEEYDCERYKQYNESFFFDETRSRILGQIDQLEKRG